MTESNEGKEIRTVDNPFPKAQQSGGGTGQMVQSDRAQSEVQAAMVVAHSRPRDSMHAMDRIIQDCTRPAVAESGLYAYPRGGETVSGPSIRLAELVAQRWGNLWCGVTELSQDREKTVAMAWAWDLETNARDERTFTVPHVRHTKRGSYPITDPRDIYEMVANYGARRKRAAIQTVVPREVFDSAVEQVELTLNATASADTESVNKMVEALGKFGVSERQIVKYVGHHLDSMVSAEMVRLRKVYTALRDGFAKPEDYFPPIDERETSSAEAIKGLGSDEEKPADKGKKATGKPKKGESKPAPEKEPEPEDESPAGDDGKSPDELSEEVVGVIHAMEAATDTDTVDSEYDYGSDIATNDAEAKALSDAHTRNTERLQG